MKERKANYIYMEYLRILCAFMVIMIHVSGANWFRLEIGSMNWIVQAFFNVAGRFSVCIFAPSRATFFAVSAETAAANAAANAIAAINTITFFISFPSG